MAKLLRTPPEYNPARPAESLKELFRYESEFCERLDYLLLKLQGSGEALSERVRALESKTV